MLSGKDKFNLLSKFKAVDYICFGEPFSEIARSENINKEFLSSYVTTKGAITSVAIEMTKLSQPKSTDGTFDESNVVTEAKKIAASSIAASVQVMKTSKARDYIKEQVLANNDKSENVEKLIDQKMVESALSFAIDSLFIGSMLTEATTLDKINGWEGLVVENTYKVLRNDLVRIVNKIKNK